MEKKYINLKDDEDLLKLWIKTKDGKETGECLIFDLKDIDLLDRYQKMIDDDKRNQKWIKDQFVIIDKKQDFTPKGKLMSNNERLKYDAIRTFFKKEKEVLDLFLGKGGVDKLLCGRSLQWNTLNEITSIIEEQITPYFDITMDNIAKSIKEKYGSQEDEVLKDE